MITGIYMVDEEIVCLEDGEERLLREYHYEQAIFYLARELSRAKNHIRKLEEFTGINEE